MPRKSRQRSRTGIYHIMIRGINKQDIFEDDHDRRRFIGILQKKKAEMGFILYAYCLMPNHVHLLIKEDEMARIDRIMHKINTEYAMHYNFKYSRVGHFFQDRFSSEVVESESYFLNVLRYIHMNPVKARLLKEPEFFLWSSMNDYYKYYRNETTWFETEHAQVYWSDFSSMLRFTLEENDDQCMDIDGLRSVCDDQLRKELSLKYDLDSLRICSKEIRYRMIRSMMEESKVSRLQLARVLGLNRRTITRALE